jgi:hypothetical protein
MMAVGRTLIPFFLWKLANTLQGMGSASKAFRQPDCQGSMNGHVHDSMHFSALHVMDTLTLCSSEPVHDGISHDSMHIWFPALHIFGLLLATAPSSKFRLR